MLQLIVNNMSAKTSNNKFSNRIILLINWKKESNIYYIYMKIQTFILVFKTKNKLTKNEEEI